MKVGVISNIDLCLPLLYFLTNNKAEVNLYFGSSTTIDPKRRAVNQFCNNYNISCSDQSEKKENVYQWMNRVNDDLVFVIGHLQKIDVRKANPKLGMYNIHFGKLPHYRGASPVFWQMKNMEPTLGLAIHELTEEMDSGPVYWQKEIRNEEHFSHNYVQYLFSNLLLEGVNEILYGVNGSPLQPVNQDESKACWYARPGLKDVLIKWDSMSAAEISTLVRACNNWNAGAITLYQGMELKIIDAMYEKTKTGKVQEPGTITGCSDSISISCRNGDELFIHYLSLNGIPFPGRLAKQYGIIEGERLTYPLD